MNQQQDIQLSSKLKSEITNAASKILDIREKFGCDYIFKEIPSTFEPPLSKSQIDEYWKTINKWKQAGYEDDIIDVLVILGMPKLDWSTLKPNDNFIDHVLGYGFVEIMTDVKNNLILATSTKKRKQKGGLE